MAKKYKVDFINSAYCRSYKAHKEEFDIAIQKCLEKGNLMFGEEMEKFEKNFAKFCRKKYCVSVRAGTDAINLAIDAVNKRYPNRKWLKQDYSYRIPKLKNVKIIKTIEGEIGWFSLCFELVEKNKNAVLITYMNSIQPLLQSIEWLKNKYEFILIEDACQAIGKPLIGDLSCFSFYPAKILGGMGKGGAVVSNNKELIDEIKKQRDNKFNNLWLDEVKCAFLNIKLKYISQEIKQRQMIANYYNDELNKINEITILSEKQLQNYIIITSKQKQLMKFLLKKGIEVFPDKNSFYEGNLENAIRLPIYGELTVKEVKYVVKTIKEFFIK